MLNIQTWNRTATWDPSNPDQQPDQFWSAADMGYRSAYWNEQPSTAQSLAGLDMVISPCSPIPRIMFIAAAGFAGYLAYKNYKRTGKVLGGSRQRARRRRRK